MLYNLDLHIHTAASSCFKAMDKSSHEINAEIVNVAKEKKINILAITDHYTLKNFIPLRTLAKANNITILPGMELSVNVNLPEKLSLIIIFNEKINPDLIENKILQQLNIPQEIIKTGNGKFLINKSITEILSILKDIDCLVISAHQDKNESRMTYIPALIDAGIFLFDLRQPENQKNFMQKFEKYNIIPLTFSDAHETNNIGKYFMSLQLSSCSYDGVKRCFEGLINV
ncbi:PHP domain-containing protein [Candidatus Poribacteria bacterium]|nr:PHP domain-containing protein [Candidatus Poribacteria bacterium]